MTNTINNWPLVPAGEVLVPVSRPEKVDSATTYRILGAHWYALGLYVKDVLPGLEIRAGEVYRVEKGDFVYNRLFGWKGSFAVASDEHQGCYVSNEFPCFTVRTDRADGRYIWKYFSRSSVWDEVLSLSTGGTPTSRNRLKENELLSMKIPLPPVEEQRRVVARIEELAGKIEEAHALRQQSAKEAEALLSNTRDSIFSVLESDPGVIRPMLGEVARFRTGYAFKSSDYRPEGRLIFRVSNIRADESVDFADSVFLASELESNYADYQLDAGDILMVMVGGSVGKLCIIPPSILPALMNQNMWRINSLDVSKLSREFLFLFLHRCNLMLGVGLTHSTHGHLTLGRYRAQRIPLPSLVEQRRIVTYLDDLQQKTNSLKALQMETSTELDAFMPSILDKAFRGEL